MTDKKKEIIALDVDGMPEKDQHKLKPFTDKYRYQVKLRLINGRIRYAHTNEEDVLTSYAKSLNAKIIWIKDHQKAT